MDILSTLIAIYCDVHKRRDVAAYIFLSLLSSFWNTLREFSWPPLPRRMADLAIVVGIVIVFNTLRTRKPDQTPGTVVNWLFLLAAVNFCVSAILALLANIPLSDIYKTMRFFYGSVLTFLVLASLDSGELKSLLKYIVITNIVICVLILIQFKTGIAFFKYDLRNEVYSELGTYGLYPPLTVWLSFVLLVSPYGNSVSALWRYAGIVLCLFITALTMIRSFTSAIVISAGISILASLNLKKKNLIMVWSLLLILGGAFRLIYGTAIYARLFAENDASWHLRVEYLQDAMKICNADSPYWGGSLENVAVDEYGATIVTGERENILSSSDHCGAFFLKFGWFGAISWLLLLWLPPLMIWKDRRQSPFMVPLLLCSFVYLPISSC